MLTFARMVQQQVRFKLNLREIYIKSFLPRYEVFLLLIYVTIFALQKLITIFFEGYTIIYSMNVLANYFIGAF